MKKMLSVLLCTAAAACCLTSCGKEIKVDDSTGTSVSDSSSASVANFTAPEKGEQIIIMNVKDYGEIKIKLFPEYADKGVENFVELAKKGYYDGLTFHRVIKDFMIQGGDPEGTGRGGESVWGGSFDGGTDAHLIHASGAVAYANSGATSTNGSQFYIVTGTAYDTSQLSQMGLNFSEEATEIYSTIGGAPWLDGGYTVFGQVFEGLDVVYKIQEVATDATDKPTEPVIMESVTVGEYDGEELHWYISDYNK
ncbi:MAG: peptidylprolyl isomerase [Ruminococcus sp.]